MKKKVKVAKFVCPTCGGTLNFRQVKVIEYNAVVDPKTGEVSLGDPEDFEGDKPECKVDSEWDPPILSCDDCGLSTDTQPRQNLGGYKKLQKILKKIKVEEVW